jgi:hypothetical protein
MATKTTQVAMTAVAHATLATWITNVNTALAAFQGSGVPGDANQFKYFQKMDSFFDGTNYVAVITYTNMVVPS